MHGSSLWPAGASADPATTIFYIAVLAGASGWIPLVLYFEGLKLTRASTAGYFEMLQTLVAVIITWGWFHIPLSSLQILGGLVLIFAVAMVQRAQEATALPPPGPEPPAARVVTQ
jgi:drug/metabolite transporter (DMT)-like permease